MKNIAKTLIYLQLTAMLMAVALSGPAVPMKEIPFHGFLAGDEKFEVQVPVLLIDGSGTGNATQLGRFTATWDREGFLPDGTLVASYHFIAANGDSLFIESIGQADDSLPPDIHVVEIGTITGGTGRFAGATGSFTLERVVILTGPDTDLTSHSFNGTIVIAKGK